MSAVGCKEWACQEKLKIETGVKYNRYSDHTKKPVPVSSIRRLSSGFDR